jgi:hypothetical protein
MSEQEAWIVSPCGDVRTAETDKFIACVFGSGLQKTERAALISAAPEMAQALERLLNPQVVATEGSTEVVIDQDSLAADQLFARCALQKAGGHP